MSKTFEKKSSFHYKIKDNLKVLKVNQKCLFHYYYYCTIKSNYFVSIKSHCINNSSKDSDCMQVVVGCLSKYPAVNMSQLLVECYTDQ